MKLTFAALAVIVLANAPAFAECALKPIENSNAFQFVDPACGADKSSAEDRFDLEKDEKDEADE